MHYDLPLDIVLHKMFFLEGEQEDEGNPPVMQSASFWHYTEKRIILMLQKTNETAQLSSGDFSLPPLFQICMHRDLRLCAD